MNEEEEQITGDWSFRSSKQRRIGIAECEEEIEELVKETVLYIKSEAWGNSWNGSFDSPVNI